MKTQIKLAAAAWFLGTLNVQLATTFAQGSLTPPGAPAPTMKTLDQIEPRTIITDLPFAITSRGSYYFTNNMGVGGSLGITVASDDVTLDLRGFTLSGALGYGTGVVVTTTVKNLVIRNGTIRGWDYPVLATNASNSHYENLQVYFSATQGMTVGDNSVVEGCTFEWNAAYGLSAGQGCVVSKCTFKGNAGLGLNIGAGGLVKDCSVVQNASDGIRAGPGSSVLDSVVTSNPGTGLVAADRCTIKNCTLASNGLGLVAGNACSVVDCNVSRSVSGLGISVGTGCTVAQCTAFYSHGVGITADTSTTIRNCTVDFGDADGILATNSCLITGNSVTRNGIGSANAGIRVVGTKNRIDENSAIGNFNTGIAMIGAGNFMIRNTASGQPTNYYAMGLSTFGPIDTGVGAISNLNPWTNFSY
jgi:hypothetical protein